MPKTIWTQQYTLIPTQPNNTAKQISYQPDKKENNNSKTNTKNKKHTQKQENTLVGGDSDRLIGNWQHNNTIMKPSILIDQVLALIPKL